MDRLLNYYFKLSENLKEILEGYKNELPPHQHPFNIFAR